jgi:hypothetical protein
MCHINPRLPEKRLGYTHFSQINKKQGLRRYSVIELLPSMHKDLSSIPSTKKREGEREEGRAWWHRSVIPALRR